MMRRSKLPELSAKRDAHGVRWRRDAQSDAARGRAVLDALSGEESREL